MEIEKLVITIMVVSLVGFGMFAYIQGSIDDVNRQTQYNNEKQISMDENFTEIYSGFSETLDESEKLGTKMTDIIESKGGFSITSAGYILLNGMYSVAKLPFDLIHSTFTLITRSSKILKIPEIYASIAFYLIVIAFIFGLISLFFRKEA